MQKVLLIGDSIRLYYQDEVKKHLGQGYEVMTIDENCRFAAYTLNSLRLWLPGFKTPDVIHWNNGLWDTAILYHEDGCFTSKEIYVENMKKILRQLKRTGAKIIFATSTPVSDAKRDLPGPMPPAMKNEDIIEYNKAVLEAFKDEDIIINDLHSLMYQDREKFISEDLIHPNPDGVKLLGKAVADVIKSCEGYRNPLKNEKAPENIKTEAKNLQ